MDYFGYLRSKESISFYEALEVLAPLFVKVHKWNIGDDVNKVRSEKYEILKNLFVQLVDKKIIEGNVFRDYEYSDDDDHPLTNSKDGPVKVIYYGNSYMKSDALYSYIVKYLDNNGYEIPQEVKILIGDNISDKNVNLVDKNNSPTENETYYGAEFETKYPKFDDININMPDKKRLEMLKKKYGELRTQKYEWDISLPIAVKIGIEFYESGLERDVDRDKFISIVKEKYNNLFKSTIKIMHDALPPTFKSKGKKILESKGIDDDTVDMIIEAAVASGLIISKEEVKDAKELEKQLTRYEFDIPPEQHLRTISGACKRVYKKYQTKQP